MNRSSTFLSLVAVLAIFLIASIAINDVDNLPVRKPFPTSGAATENFQNENSTNDLSKFQELVDGQTSTESENSDAKVFENPDQAEQTASTTLSDKQSLADLYRLDVNKSLPANVNVNKSSDLNFSSADSLTTITAAERDANQEIRFNQTVTQPEVKTIAPDTEKIQIPGFKFSTERLRAAGFSDVIIQKKPFDGTLFGNLELKSLLSFNPDYLLIFSNAAGSKTKIFEIYSFTNIEKELAGEIYDLIKYKYDGSLGVLVNESNQFGLSSFYLNFTPPSENVFLVVKFPDSVYALSYPRSEDQSLGVVYQEIVKKLL
jgi:hypothetical protein